jgi:hypothetical protein
MFGPLRSDIEARFSELESFFAAARIFDGDLAATSKGLAFVQLYAAYEFTVKSVVQTAIDSINTHAHKMKDIKPSLMALYLDRELASLRDAGRKNIWNARLRLFERVFCDDIIALANNAGPPTDGSHYRHTHLITIFNVFGIARLPARRRTHLFRIDEVVNHRNQIAHGNETAADVGRRYTRSEVSHRIRQMKSVCLLLISVFDGFCADGTSHTGLEFPSMAKLEPTT